MSRVHLRIAGLLLSCVTVSACARTTQEPEQANPSPTLLGDVRPVVSVKELMRDQIDPLSDNIFDAIGESWGNEGPTRWEPKTDEDWAKVRIGAVVLAEGANLLKIPRPFAPAGDVNNSVGPNAPELSPTEIQAKVDADETAWDYYVEGLRLVAIDVLGAVERKDVDALGKGITALDRACENCHLEYWYPGDREIYKKFFAPPPAATPTATP